MKKETNVKILGVVMTTALAVQNPVGVMAANAGVDGATVSAVNVLSNEAYDDMLQTYASNQQLDVGVFDNNIDKSIPYINRLGIYSDAKEHKALAANNIQVYPWGAYNLAVGNYNKVNSVQVYVDGMLLSSTNYSISSNGTIKLTDSYMSSLKNGSYEISVVANTSGGSYEWRHAGFIIISTSTSGNKNDYRPSAGSTIDFSKDYTDMNIMTMEEWGDVIGTLNFKDRTIDLSSRDFFVIEEGTLYNLTNIDRIIFPDNTLCIRRSY